MAWLTDQEIIRRLRLVRYSDRSARQARTAPSLRSIATRARLTDTTLYTILTGRRRLTDFHRERLSVILRDEKEG